MSTHLALFHKDKLQPESLTGDLEEKLFSAELN